MNSLHRCVSLERDLSQLYEGSSQACQCCILLPRSVDDSALGNSILCGRLEHLEEFKCSVWISGKLCMCFCRIPVYPIMLTSVPLTSLCQCLSYSKPRTHLTFRLRFHRIFCTVHCVRNSRSWLAIILDSLGQSFWSFWSREQVECWEYDALILHIFFRAGPGRNLECFDLVRHWWSTKMVLMRVLPGDATLRPRRLYPVVT